MSLAKLSVTDVCRDLKISRQHAYKLIEQGKLPARNISSALSSKRNYRVSPDDLALYKLTNHTTPQTEEN